jgi:hypothetical protein
METTVPGLLLHHDFISESMEDELINEIDSQTWVVDYNRRLQYYGYRNELEAPYNLTGFSSSYASTDLQTIPKLSGTGSYLSSQTRS